jgi:hypothetical protein
MIERIKETIDEMIANNPWPSGTSTEPTKEEWVELDKACESYGLIREKFIRALSRLVYDTCLSDLKARLVDLERG